MDVDVQEAGKFMPSSPSRPVVPIGHLPPISSPITNRYKDKFRAFGERDRPGAVALEKITDLPTGADSSAATLQTLANGMNTLITGINAMNETLRNTVKLKDLQEFREMQSEEIKEVARAVADERVAPVVAEVEELSKGQARLDDRVVRLEAQMAALNVNEIEKMQMKMLNRFHAE